MCKVKRDLDNKLKRCLGSLIPAKAANRIFDWETN